MNFKTSTSERFLAFAIAGLLLASTLLLSSCSPAGDSASEDVSVADLVLRGGKIATVDDQFSIQQAVAVRGHEIVAVGSDQEIASWIGADTRVVELDGRLVTPGFIEGHGHFMSLGSALMVLDLTTATRWQDIVDQVAEAAAEAPPGTWIRGRGWHQEKWSQPPPGAVEGNPVHAQLSAVSPDNPVLLGHASGHAAFANQKALELAGLDRTSEDPPGGELVRDASGELTGLLRETAQRAVSAAMARDLDRRSDEEKAQERLAMVELAGREALSKGVTSFHDAGVDFDTIDFLKGLEAEGRLPIRLYSMVRFASNEEMAEKLPLYRSTAEDNDFMTVRSIKRQIDGALGAHGAWLLEPYDDLPTSVGLVLEPEEEIRRTVELALENGYQVNTHAIGDRANRVVLDIYQQAGVSQDQRFRIEHAQHVDPEDLPRFADLGVIASVQGVHCTSDGPWIPRRLGEERTERTSYRWRDMIDSGGLVTNGTDVPVEDIDPIASYYASVGRVMPDGSQFYPEQKMTREEALRSYTINNAYASFEESQKGSIEVGKLADMVVLSKDILTAAIDELPGTRVDMTVVGGEIVYDGAAAASGGAP